MTDSRGFNRWWLCYCVLELKLTYPELKGFFPSVSWKCSTGDWERWSEFFRAKMIARFAGWTNDDHSTTSFGVDMGFVRRRGSVFMQELKLHMEAEANVTMLLGPVSEIEMPLMWTLYLQGGRLWIGYPSGKRLVLPRWGTHLRIERLARHAEATAKLAVLEHKED
jgi:hypothetical protein